MKVVRENGKSIRRYSDQGRFEVWVIQLRLYGKPKTTWISKVKENLNEMNFSCFRKRTSQLRTLMIGLELSSDILIFDLYLKTFAIFR